MIDVKTGETLDEVITRIVGVVTVLEERITKIEGLLSQILASNGEEATQAFEADRQQWIDECRSAERRKGT